MMRTAFASSRVSVPVPVPVVVIPISLCVLVCLACASEVLVSGQHVTCTKGRLILGNKLEARIHMMDLDDTNIQAYQTAGGVNPSLAWTSSGLVISSFPGTLANNYSDGIVQFWDVGIELDDHGDHKDVDKGPFVAYSPVVAGVRASHIVPHANYIGIFFDGFYSAIESQRHPAAAVFIKESELLQPNPIVNPIVFKPAATGGAQHGVAIALAENRFLMSVAHPLRAQWSSTFNSPIGLAIYNASGSVIANLSDVDNPDRSCVGYHGSAEAGNEYVFGCAGYTSTSASAGAGMTPASPAHAGVLTMKYNPANDQIMTRKLAYPSTDGRRISTFMNQPGTNNMVGSFGNTNTSLSSSLVLLNTDDITLMGDESGRVYTNPVNDTKSCTFMFERSANARLVTFWPSGVANVMVASRTGWSLERSIPVLSPPTPCSSLTFTTGFDVFVVADSTTNKVHLLTLSTGALQTKSLTFTPGQIVIAVSDEAACQPPPATKTTTPPPTNNNPTNPSPTGTAHTTAAGTSSQVAVMMGALAWVMAGRI